MIKSQKNNDNYQFNAGKSKFKWNWRNKATKIEHLSDLKWNQVFIAKDIVYIEQKFV